MFSSYKMVSLKLLCTLFNLVLILDPVLMKSLLYFDGNPVKGKGKRRRRSFRSAPNCAPVSPRPTYMLYVLKQLEECGCLI